MLIGGCLTLWIALAPAPLIEAPGVALVRAHCTACHSEHLITQNRDTAAGWTRTIRWMQATQNLWPLDTKTEGTIVAYLAKNYPPRGAFRRAPLHPSLMPPKVGTLPPPQKVSPPGADSSHIPQPGTPPPQAGISCACQSSGEESPPLVALITIFVFFFARRPRASSA